MKALKIYMTMGLLLVSSLAMAQISRISGTVSDDFDVLPGVNVVEIDASNRMVNATVTDMNGNFVLPVKSQKNKVKFSYMGFKTITLPINKTVFQVKREENAKQMPEVQVTAKKKLKTSGLAIPEREVSFSAQGISAKEFEGLGITSVDEALQGRIAGLDIVANSGDLGSGTSMRLRGASTVSTLTSNEPLIVVNGNVWNVDMSDFDTATANEEKFAQLLNVNTEDIEDIKVLKDAAATAIWGSQGANGVIEITTKRGKSRATRIGVRLYGGFETTPNTLDVMNGEQHRNYLSEILGTYVPANATNRLSYLNGIANLPFMNEDKSYTFYPQYHNNQDWQKDLYRTAFTQVVTKSPCMPSHWVTPSLTLRPVKTTSAV